MIMRSRRNGRAQVAFYIRPGDERCSPAGPYISHLRQLHGGLFCKNAAPRRKRERALDARPVVRLSCARLARLEIVFLVPAPSAQALGATEQAQCKRCLGDRQADRTRPQEQPVTPTVRRRWKCSEIVGLRHDRAHRHNARDGTASSAHRLGFAGRCRARAQPAAAQSPKAG